MRPSSPLSYLVSNQPAPYYLVLAPIPADAPKPKPSAVDHVLIIDVSGSMAGELNDIADQITNKLPTMIEPGHTLTLIRYSGRGQCDMVFQGRPISGEIGSFAAVGAAIRRALRPVGMTAFVDPFVKTREVVTALRRANPTHEISVYLQTDGCETEGYSTAEILQAAAALAPLVSSFTVFEYGSYCDRRLLASIAATMGGEHVPCRAFLDYDPAIAQRVARKGGRGMKREVEIQGTMLGGEPFAFSLDDGAITLYAVESGKVSVGETVKAVAYLSALPVGSVVPGGLAEAAATAAKAGVLKAHASAPIVDLAYAALAVLVQRQDMDEAFGILGALADVRFAGLADNAFTRPEYDAVVDAARAAAFGQGRFAEGRDAARVPRYDAWTVVQTLYALDDPETRLVLDDPAHPFEYQRIGRAKDAGALLREEDMARIQVAMESIPAVIAYRGAIEAGGGKLPSPPSETVKLGEAITDAADDFFATMPTVTTAVAFHKTFGELVKQKVDETTIAVSSAVLDAIVNAKPKLSLVEDKPAGGYPIDGLVFSKERANVSLRVRLQGVVDTLPALPPVATAPWAKLAQGTRAQLASLSTTTYRNFAVIRDGMLNLRSLPVRLGRAAWATLAAQGVVSGPYTGDVISLDLTRLPVINRAMATGVKASDLLSTAYESIRLGAALKVIDSYRDLWSGSPGFAARFGTDIATWLNDIGVRDSGFNPPAPKTKGTGDVAYHARVMKIGIAGLSDLPTVEEVRTRRAEVLAVAKGGGAGKGKAPKLTAGMALMEPTLAEVEGYLAAHKLAVDPFDAEKLAGFKAWLDDKAETLGTKKRVLDRLQSGRIFVMVAAGVRPSDLAPGETTITTTLANGVVVKGKIEAQLKPVAA